MIEKAKNYAIECHRKVNHLYDGKPYEVHLQMVVEEAERYSYLVPQNLKESFVASAWIHDVIEDCRETYNDVKNATSVEVAEYTYALTNEKGKTRKERASQKYYDDMEEVCCAKLLKICDRIANVKYSKQTGSRMFEMYKKENEDFILMIGEEFYEPINNLRELLWDI